MGRAAALGLAIVLVTGGGAGAATYRWVDEQGVVHYAEGIDSVPERYRSVATAGPSAVLPSAREAAPPERRAASVAPEPPPNPRRWEQLQFPARSALYAVNGLKNLGRFAEDGVDPARYHGLVVSTEYDVRRYLDRHQGDWETERLIRASMTYYVHADRALDAQRQRLSIMRSLFGDLTCRHVRKLMATHDDAGVQRNIVTVLRACARDLTREAERALELQTEIPATPR